MSLFSRKPRRQIGIDIGTSSIKVVELSRKDPHPQLLNYGILEGVDFFGDISPVPNISSTFKMSEQEITTSLKQLLSFSNIKTKEAILSIPAFSSFLTVMEMPFMDIKELGKAVPFQARSYIPVPLSEVVVDWLALPPRAPVSASPPRQVSPTPSSSGKNILATMTGVDTGSKPVPSKRVPAPKSLIKPLTKPRTISVLLVAVPKEVIGKYQRIVKGAGLELRALEAESFSLVRSLVGNDLSPVALVDFGARSTGITIVDQGFIKMSHNVDISGKEITRVISRGLNVSMQRAEELKRSKGLLRGEVDQGVAGLVEPLFGKLISELNRMSTAYLRKDGVKVKKIILSGGAARLPGLVEYLTKKLFVGVVVGNPFARVLYPPKLEKIVKQDLSSSLAFAVGLAKRDF